MYKVVALGRAGTDVIAMLEKLSSRVCDIRVAMPAGGSVEARQAAAAILSSAIDSLRAVRNNGNRDEPEDDDPL